MIHFDDNRIVTPRKIQKALNEGNLEGVRRLAKFVCADSLYPDRVFEACENQRMFLYLSSDK